MALAFRGRDGSRIDVYAGVALSNVCAGLANGFQQTQNIDPTAGVRVKFLAAAPSPSLRVGKPASEIHSDADRRREVDAVEIAARQTAGDLRPQEAAVSLDALSRTITDHPGEGAKSAAAAWR